MNKSVMIAVPHYNNAPAEFVSSMFNLGKWLVRNNINHGLLLSSNSSHISLCRSNIVNKFLHHTEHDYLLWLDNDVVFKPEQVGLLLEANKPFVCGTYPCKVLPTRYTLNMLSKNRQPILDEHNKDLYKIKSTGFGFVLTHRTVYEQMMPNIQNLKIKPNNQSIGNSNIIKTNENEINNSYHWFADYIENSIAMGEDMSFCKRWLDIGGEIWLHKNCNLAHVGSHIFEPSALF